MISRAKTSGLEVATNNRFSGPLQACEKPLQARISGTEQLAVHLIMGAEYADGFRNFFPIQMAIGLEGFSQRRADKRRSKASDGSGSPTAAKAGRSEAKTPGAESMIVPSRSNSRVS